jgi:LuxR family glucitol operon transcriptional activator
MTAIRLNLFALLMALELDLRVMLSRGIADGVVPLTADEVRKAEGRLIVDRPDAGDVLWPDLVPYLDLSELLDVLLRHAEALGRSIGTDGPAFKAVIEPLRDIVSVRNRVCHARLLEPDDSRDVRQAVRSLHTRLGDRFRLSNVADYQNTIRANPEAYAGAQIPVFWRKDVRTIHSNLPEPDFADTGFVGRDQDRQSISQLLAGAHPIITVTGEGGVGKTSLALRCLYDIVEQSQDYDVVVWSTMKTAALTTSGVRSIAGALGNELSLLRGIAAEVGPDPGELDKTELVDLVLGLLGECRVLLVIDNMETIDREALRPLFASVPRGSKILLTSRIGIGEFENRYPLQGMIQRDAINLIRNTARLYNAADLAKRDDAALNTLADALYRNPLAIRWFVQGYSEGRTITDLLNKRGSLQDVLNFCFHTLYESLDDGQKAVLRTFVATGKPLSEVQVALLTETWDIEHVRSTIQYLFASNLLTRSDDEWQSGSSTLWTTTKFAKDYILSKDRGVASARLGLQNRYKALIVARDQARDAAAANAFAASTISFRTTDQAMVVRLLTDAAQASRAGNSRAANDLLERAKKLQPEFYEVWRISSFVREQEGDLLGAQADFETAVELADGASEPLLVHFAHFLRRQQDFSSAVNVLEDAAAKPAASPALIATYGWMLALAGSPEKAVAQYDRVADAILSFGFEGQRHLLTQYVEVVRREAEVRLNQRRFKDSVVLLVKAMGIANRAAGLGLIDFHFVRTVQDCVAMALQALTRQFDSDLWKEARAQLIALGRHFEVIPDVKRPYLERLCAQQEEVANDNELLRLVHATAGTGLRLGIVRRPFPANEHTVIVADDGTQYWMHRSHLLDPGDWAEICDGDSLRVSFKPEDGAPAAGRRPKAYDVALESNGDPFPD